MRPSPSSMQTDAIEHQGALAFVLAFRAALLAGAVFAGTVSHPASATVFRADSPYPTWDTIGPADPTAPVCRFKKTIAHTVPLGVTKVFDDLVCDPPVAPSK